MAKGENKAEGVIENGETKPKETKPNTTKKQEKPKQMGLEVRNPDSTFSLRTKRGTKIKGTLEEMLKPHNFNQLSKRYQEMLKGKGKSTHVLLQEIAAKK